MKYVSIIFASILFIVLGAVGYNLIRNQINSLDKKEEPISQIELNELKKTGTKLRFSVKGPVVADENYHEIVFEVGQGTRSVKFYKGYNQELVKEQQLSNNYKAYEAFAGALYSSGFMTERSNVKNKKYENQCSSGKVYNAELLDSDNKVKKSLWITSCNSKSGTLLSSPTTVLNLFKKQFPDYNTFSSGISID